MPIAAPSENEPTRWADAYPDSRKTEADARRVATDDSRRKRTVPSGRRTPRAVDKEDSTNSRDLNSAPIDKRTTARVEQPRAGGRRAATPDRRATRADKKVARPDTRVAPKGRGGVKSKSNMMIISIACISILLLLWFMMNNKTPSAGVVVVPRAGVAAVPRAGVAAVRTITGGYHNGGGYNGGNFGGLPNMSN